MQEINVQTTVSESLYEALWRAAKAQRRPLKALVREAIEAYVGKAAAEKDPLFTFVGHGNLKASNWSQRKDWRI